MATRRGSLLGGKRADGARSAAKWLLSVAFCLLLVQGGRTQTQSPSKFFVHPFVGVCAAAACAVVQAGCFD